MVTLKYDPTGKLSWATNYFGPETNVQPVAITFDADGNICVSGISSDHGPTLALVKYDPQGNQLSAQHSPRRELRDRLGHNQTGRARETALVRPLPRRFGLGVLCG